MKSSYVKNGKSHILYDAGRISQIDERYFSSDWWRGQDALIGTARGRGTTAFVRNGVGEMVLRHYRRGGLMAHISYDCYLWTGLENTRAWREWKLLVHLHELNLPVPEPVAVRVMEGRMCYRADILMTRIHGDSLAQRMLREKQSPETWRAVGACIRRFHDAGVYHADLNAHNILLDEKGAVYLIDFDRGRLREAGGWQQANLDRLLRSLRKLDSLHLDFHYCEREEWTQLLDAYGQWQ